MTDAARARRLDRPVDPARDHVLGNPAADITLVEYGSYVCPHCHAAHEVIANLRDQFGDRMRYVFRQFPLPGDDAMASATLAEYAAATTGDFWPMHDALMTRGPKFAPGELNAIAQEYGLPEREEHRSAWQNAEARVRDDAESARSSGARGTPTFFINGRRYEGAWDESALAEAMQDSLGHRLQAASLAFARWAPSTGLLLLAMTVIAVILTNSAIGPTFQALWHEPLGIQFDKYAFTLPLIEWINDGLLSVFFLVVGLEIKRELTVGRLASRRAAALPITAAIGGMIVPALIYLFVVGPMPYGHAWGMTITTDTAFAIALIVLLGDRVPVDLRIFLTAAVIVDDLAAIVILALFYSGTMNVAALIASALVTAMLIVLNRSGIYRVLPYAALGMVLWFLLHEAGLHATLTGVILAAVTPTRPPGNLRALLAQAQMVLQSETRARENVMRHGPSEPALRQLDAIHDRIESPASKLLRTVEPWSSYVVLPIFALANAGLVWSTDVLPSHLRLVLATMLGLVIGKPLGIVSASWLAARLGLAIKPASYSWRQLAGAGTLAGIGFTMSLFIARQAFPDNGDFTAAKLAIFCASLIASVLGVSILWRRQKPESQPSVQEPEEIPSFAHT